ISFTLPDISSALSGSGGIEVNLRALLVNLSGLIGTLKPGSFDGLAVDLDFVLPGIGMSINDLFGNSGGLSAFFDLDLHIDSFIAHWDGLGAGSWDLDWREIVTSLIN